MLEEMKDFYDAAGQAGVGEDTPSPKNKIVLKILMAILIAPIFLIGGWVGLVLFLIVGFAPIIPILRKVGILDDDRTPK